LSAADTSSSLASLIPFSPSARSSFAQRTSITFSFPKPRAPGKFPEIHHRGLSVKSRKPPPPVNCKKRFASASISCRGCISGRPEASAPCSSPQNSKHRQAAGRGIDELIIFRQSNRRSAHARNRQTVQSPRSIDHILRRRGADAMLNDLPLFRLHSSRMPVSSTHWNYLNPASLPLPDPMDPDAPASPRRDGRIAARARRVTFSGAGHFVSFRRFRPHIHFGCSRTS